MTPQQIEAVNRRVHEVCGRGCWHDIDTEYCNDGEVLRECRICKSKCAPNPDYWRDANACLVALAALAAMKPKAFMDFKIQVYGGHVTFWRKCDDHYGLNGYDRFCESVVSFLLAMVGESVESVIQKAGKA